MEGRTLLITQATDGTMFGICVVGLFLNGLVLYVCGMRMRLRGLDLKLSCLTALIDLMFCGVFITLVALKWAVGGDIVRDNSPWCAASGVLLVETAVCSVGMVAMLALARYLTIAKGRRLSTSLWLGIATVYALLSLGMALGLLDDGRFKVMPSGSYCEPGWFHRAGAQARPPHHHRRRHASYPRIYTLVILTQLTLFVLVIGLAYTGITLKYRHRIAQASGNLLLDAQRDPGYWPALAKQRRRVTLAMVAILVAYGFNLIPMVYSSWKAMGLHRPAHPAFDAVSAALMAALVITNPLFVLLVHEDTYRELLSLFRCRRSPETSHPYSIS